MKIIVNSEEMKYCDSNTISHFGVPSLVLMERAALSIIQQVPQSCRRVLLACGNGNNGADGLAAARLLFQRGFDVTVAQMPGHGKRTPENLQQRDILERYGIKIHDSIPEDTAYDCVIDALFGIGLSRAPQGEAAGWIAAMNRLDGFKIAADMPSGVSSDTGMAYEPSFQADLTVTFAYQKAGQVFYPGCEKCGTVLVAEIGITDESWLKRRPSCYAFEKKDLQRLPKRPPRSHKGTFGRLLVIAGSRNMAGAAVFSAQAAYRTGCGLVKICTPQENRVIMQCAVPQAVVDTFDTALPLDREQFQKNLDWADVIVLGPGIGTDDFALQMTGFVMEHANVPLVLDADALNIIAVQPQLMQKVSGRAVLTPHPGEMSRLCGRTVPEIQEHLLETAAGFAREHGVILVLKDAVTVTASQDAAYLNMSGCSAMAKAGSGDILAGMIAALAAQGMPLETAAPLGVFAHGTAGEQAARKKGMYSVLAEDILECIGVGMCGE